MLWDITQAQDQELLWSAQHVVLSMATVKDAQAFQHVLYAQQASLEASALYVLLVIQEQLAMPA